MTSTVAPSSSPTFSSPDEYTILSPSSLLRAVSRASTEEAELTSLASAVATAAEQPYIQVELGNPAVELIRARIILSEPPPPPEDDEASDDDEWPLEEEEEEQDDSTHKHTTNNKHVPHIHTHNAHHERI